MISQNAPVPTKNLTGCRSKVRSGSSALSVLWFAIILSARNSLTWHGMETNNRGHARLFLLDLSIRPALNERSPDHRDRKCCLATATRGVPAKAETTGSDAFRSTVLDLSPQLVVRLAPSINLCPG